VTSYSLKMLAMIYFSKSISSKILSFNLISVLIKFDSNFYILFLNYKSDKILSQLHKCLTSFLFNTSYFSVFSKADLISKRLIF